MHDREALWLAHQRRRWMMPDPSRWLQPDQSKWLQPDQSRFQPPQSYERKYSPDQPRVPAGNPEGGQWTGGGGDGEEPSQSVPIFADGRYVQLAGDVPTNGLPEVPKEKPATIQDRNRIVRRLKEFTGPLDQLLERGSWLKENLAELSSYRDPPRELADLNEAATVPAPRGYHNHHIVEQGPARDGGLPEELIEGYDNLARVPKLKHEEITAWFNTKNEDFGMMSPRDYLRNKDWNERRRVGLHALRRVGVLK
jgi:hypothetical protein